MSRKRGSWVRSFAVTALLVLLSAVPVFGSESLAVDEGPVAPALLTTFVPAAVVPASLFDEQRPATLKAAAPSKPIPSGTIARRALVVSFAALQGLDAHSTFKALDTGAKEINPLLAGLANNRGAMLAVKAGTAVAGAFFIEKMAKQHPKRALIAAAVMNTVYAAVVAHNYRLARARR